MSDGEENRSYDYSAFDASRRSFGFRLDDQKRIDLFQISQRVAEEHGIVEAGMLAAHHRLVLELWHHMGTQSRTYLEDGALKIAADAPHQKSATEDILPRLNKHLSQVVELLHQGAENEVFLTLVHDAAAEDDEPGDQVWALFKFAETIERASKFKGRAGRRRRPDWVKDFCVSCQRFWSEQELGNTSLGFDAPNPPKITIWLEQLFEELRAYRRKVDPSFTLARTSSVSAMKKVAKTLPAYRPPNTGENGV